MVLATNQLRPGNLLIIDRQPQEECLETRGNITSPILAPQTDSRCMRRMNAEIQG